MSIWNRKLGKSIVDMVGSILGKARAGKAAKAKIQPTSSQIIKALDVINEAFPVKPTQTARPGASSILRGGSNQVEMRLGGRVRRYPRNHPIVTGEMIPATSSNVHSFGFQWNFASPEDGTLLVRYLGKRPRGERSGPGPIYEYLKVHPDVFSRMLIANSKGSFVWDELRIRGTISGHQYAYRLAGLGMLSRYVPRIAARVGTQEMFLPRHIKAIAAGGEMAVSNLRGARVMTSSLPKQEMGRALRGKNFTAGGAMPNRGKPNRGRL